MPHLFDKYPKLKDILKLNPTHKDGRCVAHTRTVSDYLVSGEFHPERYAGLPPDESISSDKHSFEKSPPSSMIIFLKELAQGTVLSVHNEDHSYNILIDQDEVKGNTIWLVDSSFGVVSEIESEKDLSISLSCFPEPLGTSFGELLIQDQKACVDFFYDGEDEGVMLFIEGHLHPSFSEQPSMGDDLSESADDVESEFKP